MRDIRRCATCNTTEKAFEDAGGGAMKASSWIAAKMNRLATESSAHPRVLDLFSGCGGLSLGFLAAGCEIVAAVELDELAARSHALNFHKGASPEVIELHAKPRDITSIDPEDLTDEFALGVA